MAGFGLMVGIGGLRLLRCEGRQSGSPRSLSERGWLAARPRSGLFVGDAKGKVARQNQTLHNAKLYNTVLRVGAGCGPSILQHDITPCAGCIICVM